jgi:hypothetical protein
MWQRQGFGASHGRVRYEGRSYTCDNGTYSQTRAHGYTP